MRVESNDTSDLGNDLVGLNKNYCQCGLNKNYCQCSAQSAVNTSH